MSPCVVVLAEDLVVPDEAAALVVEDEVAGGAAEAGRVPALVSYLQNVRDE